MSSVQAMMVQHCADVAGSAISGLLSAQALMNSGCQVDVAFASDGPMRAQYETLGCTCHVVPHKNWLGSPRLFRTIRNLSYHRKATQAFVRLFSRLQPKIVYINNIVSMPAARAAKRLNIPCVWHLRELFADVGGEMHAPVPGGRLLVRRAIWSLSDHVIVNSKAVAENVLGVSRHPRLTVIPNAVSDSFFEAAPGAEEYRSKLVPAAAGIMVGVPGTLRPMKGHPLLLDAAESLVRRYDSVSFVITGEVNTEYAESLRTRVEREGLSDRIRFAGRVSDMRSFYAACDIVCVPSRAEPFGRVVIEAMACGKPVVATAVGGIREIIEHERTGWLVPPGDAAALAEIISQLIAQPGQRRTVGDEARVCAAREYREATYRSRLVAIVADYVTR